MSKTQFWSKEHHTLLFCFYGLMAAAFGKLDEHAQERVDQSLLSTFSDYLDADVYELMKMLIGAGPAANSKDVQLMIAEGLVVVLQRRIDALRPKADDVSETTPIGEK